MSRGIGSFSRSQSKGTSRRISEEATGALTSGRLSLTSLGGLLSPQPVPQGTFDRSPVRSAGLAFLKSHPSRPVRRSQDDEGGTGRSTDAGNRGAACETKSRTFLSSLTGRTCLFASFPSTSYWASFGPTGKCSAENHINLGCRVLWRRGCAAAGDFTGKRI
jgi:hypothetical protein